MIIDAARVLIPSVVSFVIGIAMAPLLAHYLYKYKTWKKKGGKGNGMGDTNGTPLFDELHREREVSTPRMGGIIVWGATLLTALGISFFSMLFGEPFASFDFMNRSQTWIPLFALAVGALVGLVDDILEVTSSSGGLKLRYRLLVVAGLGAFAGWWFYAKLGVSAIGMPFIGPIELGPFFVLFFILVTLALYAGGIIDGIDGLAGGIFAIIFMTYAGIAFAQEQTALAAFAATVSGALFAFLWFNIPPARFYLSETGTMALTVALSITAFSADVLGEGVGVAVLPIIALPLTVTVATTVLQAISKKVFKKKLFRIAPIHHHFEAVGWPAYKVTMRYWVITIIAGIFGLALALLK
ncbi:MAG: phospho-N-acetylmuramoyl-pentapeptide-transferase [Parcubacteria bacterium C7867-004]|nr:MAG: phospho-N-acetylmuramoyl-pentapeptide-transferase [Parcubacteria bacterium C7867-004]